MKEENKAILRSRAREMAQEPEKQTTDSLITNFLIFDLAGETYGINATFVREVYPLKDYTSLPGVPSYILGILNVRGQILTIVNLKKLFKLPEKGLGELNKVIIIRNHKMEFGIMADSIMGIKTFPYDSIGELPATFTGVGSDYLKGITPENIIILDGEKILGDNKIIIDEKIDIELTQYDLNLNK